ncbi:MAG: AAA family ATPase [Bacteroidaceae bacterium]|nr:AAA family ATPase [Bacteroidaceae bacterium]
MIKRIVLNKFKSLNSKTIELQDGMTLVVGGNNSGKSTLLHALAVWEFCKTVLVYEKSPTAICRGFRGDGYGISTDDFTPINIPSFRYLWTNLKITTNYSLSLDCYWDDKAGVEKHLKIGLAYNQERLFIKNLDSTISPGDYIPRVAYLPTFAGIERKEEWHSVASRNRYVGRGLAGAVLRNQIMELYKSNLDYREAHKNEAGRLSKADLEHLRENDPYEILQQVILAIFKGVLYPKEFNPEFHTHVNINFRKGVIVNKRFQPDPAYPERDIMVEGSGFLQWLSVYTFALSPSVDTLLLDEPDAHLHCSLQGELFNYLGGIAKKKGKQVLVATHSSEVIKTFDFSKILFIDGGSVGYLNAEDTKIRVLSGLGTEYFPKLSQIERTKRLLFVENQSDADFLIEFCRKYSKWPDNLAIWPLANKHKERKVLFLYLKDQIPDLKCISLSDRDNESYNEIARDLSRRGMPDLNVGGELRYRTWRRWEMESYLFCKPAIVRLIVSKGNGISEEAAAARFDSCVNSLGLVYPADYRQSDRTLQNGRLFDTDAKEILDPICATFGIDKYEIAKEMSADEIFEDVRTLIDELVVMCS